MALDLILKTTPSVDLFSKQFQSWEIRLVWGDNWPACIQNLLGILLKLFGKAKLKGLYDLIYNILALSRYIILAQRNPVSIVLTYVTGGCKSNAATVLGTTASVMRDRYYPNLTTILICQINK